MGVLLTPIIVKETPPLSALAGKRLAVDGNGELYQFLALIRQRDGTPLRDEQGRTTSHLVGLFYRTTRLIGEYGLQLAFVFDGVPPTLKAAEIRRRRDVRARYESEHRAALEAGDLEAAYSKATMTSRVSRGMVDEAKELLRLLGIPVVQAPGEGEAQAAALAASGDVWAAASKDYDTLLFGAPRLLRFLTVAGKEFLPSTGAFRPLVPELIDADALLSHHRITREQLVDLAILVGTDFAAGIKGIGPKKALKLVQMHGSIDRMPPEIRNGVAGYDAIRAIYLSPLVYDPPALEFRPPDRDGVVHLLCDVHAFSRTRVVAALDRMGTARLDF
jgi:flap endonuclease-1